MYDDSSDLSPIAGNREKRKKKGESGCDNIGVARGCMKVEVKFTGK